MSAIGFPVLRMAFRAAFLTMLPCCFNPHLCASPFSSGNNTVNLPPDTYNVVVESSDTSTLNISGGIFNGVPAPAPHALQSLDNSKMNITGGQFNGDIFASGHSTINFYAGESRLLIYTGLNGSINIYGGTFTSASEHSGLGNAGGIMNIYGGDVLTPFGQSGGRMTIRGGYFPFPYQVNAGTASVFGGDFRSNLGVNGDAALAVYGGDFQSDLQVSTGTLSIFGGHLPTKLNAGSGTILIYGNDFNYPLGPVSGEVVHITGILTSGSPINVDAGQSTGKIILVPEPGTALSFLTLTLLYLFPQRPRRIW